MCYINFLAVCVCVCCKFCINFQNNSGQLVLCVSKTSFYEVFGRRSDITVYTI